MSFKQKTWNDRISEYPNRRTLTDVSDNITKIVNVAREEGTISQEGDAFSAANMNDLEGRIADGFSTLSQDSLKMSSSNPSSDSIKFGINASGQYGYIKQGASEVTPFRNPTGNANPSDVLSGKTFSTASLENARGSMPNRGGHQSSTGVGGGSGSLYAYMPYGYYDNHNNSGNAWIDITNDQAKTLANNAGVGYNSGYAKGNAHVTYKDFHVTAQAASENADSSKTFNAHLNGYTMIGYGLIKTGGVGWNWWRPYTFNISNSGENITVSVSGGGGGYDSTSDSSRWKNLDCTVRVFYK